MASAICCIRVKCTFIIVVFVALAGCDFNGSTLLPPGYGSDKQDEVGDPDAGQRGCDGFVSSPCSECGLDVCEDLPDGSVNIPCEPDPDPGRCEESYRCDSEARCVMDEPPDECTPGTNRTCGECGIEVCQGGHWSGTCVADQMACDTGTLCLPKQSQGELACQAACSTQGHQLPAWEEEIPDLIEVDTQWDSIDNCPLEDEYSTCYCLINAMTGNPEVVCDPCDWL